MRLKKSHFFYAFVLLFVASVYYFDYYKGEETKKKKDEAAVLVPFSKDQINKIELQIGSDEIQLIKDDKGWKLTKPLEDFADENAISDWLNSLLSEKNTDSVGEGETINWATYGLDKPKATLIIYSSVAKATGSVVKIELSPRKNFEGSTFLRKDQGAIVLLASANWQSLLEKTVRDLRDKRVLRQPMSDVVSVGFKRRTDQLDLQTKEGLWFIKDKIGLKLSQNSVREVVNAISEMRAQEFSLESDPNEKQKIEYGLQAPQFKALLVFKDAKTWSADFSQSINKTWYAWVKDLHKVFKLDNVQVDKILKANVDSLRDREAPFVFKKDDVKKVAIQILGEPKNSMELNKEGESWKSSQPGPVNEKELSGLLNRLAELRIGEFLDGRTQAPGIDPAKRKVVLSDSEGKIIFAMSIGDSYKKKTVSPQNVNQFFYIKTSSYNDVVAVADSGINGLAFDKIMKVEVPKSTDQKSTELMPKNSNLEAAESINAEVDDAETFDSEAIGVDLKKAKK